MNIRCLRRASSWFSLLVLMTLLIGESCQAIHFYLKQAQRICFTEPLPSDTKVVAEFMVAAGKGEMPVNFELKDHSGKTVHFKKNITHGKFSFRTPESAHDYEDEYYDYDESYMADISGTLRYEMCFEHKPTTAEAASDLTRRVSFKFLKGSTARDYEKLAKDDHLSGLEVNLEVMGDELSQLLKELEDVRLREDALRSMNEATNKKVVLYSSIACVIMVIAGGYQMLHMKSYFRKKKLI